MKNSQETCWQKQKRREREARLGLSKGHGKDVGVNSPMGSLILNRKVTRILSLLDIVLKGSLQLL